LKNPFGGESVTVNGFKASDIVQQLEKLGVTHVVTLPDSETSGMYRALGDSNTIHMVPIAREGEAIPIATGLWAAGRKPVVVIQNSGVYESGDALRGLAIGVSVPIVMFVGYRGYTRHGDTPDTAAEMLEPYLHLWRVPFYLMETSEDIDRIPMAFKRADETSLPVAVLIGAEYAPEESEIGSTYGANMAGAK
jgi:sulfopyruvate decarboxylase TPP-binding subunit